MSGALARLPEGMRGELKEPLGGVTAEVEEERLRGDGRVIAVGDMVAYHLLEAGVAPDVAVVDGRTKREEVDEEVVESWSALPLFRRVENEPGTVSRGLVVALREALGKKGKGDGVLVEVDGEEDLAVLPALVLADEGDTVVYGQPGEGMVYVEVNSEKSAQALGLLRRMDGDEGALERALGLRNS
jgi:uncharacterized protein (UPF0218 family)